MNPVIGISRQFIVGVRTIIAALPDDDTSEAAQQTMTEERISGPLITQRLSTDWIVDNHGDILPVVTRFYMQRHSGLDRYRRHQ